MPEQMTAELDSTLVDSHDSHMLLEFLRDRNVPCPLCGYNLRGLLSARCPECGRDLELRVGLAEPRQGAWLTAQIAVAATGGIGCLALISICVNGWPQGMPHAWLFNFAFIYYLGSIPVAALLLIKRRRYLRLPQPVQRWIAAAAIVGAIVSLVACILGGGA